MCCSNIQDYHKCPATTMTSINPTEKKSEREGRGVGSSGDSAEKNVTSPKEVGKENDLEPEIAEKDFQSAGAQFENPRDDHTGNTVVDRGKYSKSVEEKGDDTQSSDSTKVDTDVEGKTTNASYHGRKEDEKHDNKSVEEGVGSSGDSAEKNVTSPKEGVTKPSAPQTKTETEKQVDEKRHSKSGSPQHPPYSGLPQQRPQQIREGTDSNLPWIGIVLVFASVVCGYYMHFSGSTPNKIPKQLDMVEVFNQEMEKLKASFPSQRPELWKRSLIHIRRHLKTEHPTEPVSLILTSGRRAEKTLGCLAQCLAQAFSATRNSTFLNIDGKAKTSLDSDQVKLDIDSELTKAFESEKFAAVIHRFEELPPGSTLIFYRYCDHENAAYKNVFLAFTVMLHAEAEVPSNVNLGRIEEMVQDHVRQKFVSSDKSAVFNQMDVDKLSGLWSRISHLILPVASEERIEQQGCGGCDKPF